MGDDLQDEIDLAVEHVAFADLRQGGDMVFKGAQIGFGLALQADHGEHGDAIAQRHRIQIGVIALDDAIFFQRAHAAQAGRGGEASPSGKIDVGDAAFGLQMTQDHAIDIVDRQPRTMHH